jgi:ribosome assembly protein YihI (activator of Der GTPase)
LTAYWHAFLFSINLHVGPSFFEPKNSKVVVPLALESFSQKKKTTWRSKAKHLPKQNTHTTEQATAANVDDDEILDKYPDPLGDVEQLSLEREGQFTAETVASLDDKGVLYDKMLDMKVGIDRRNAGTTITPPRDDQRSHESNTPTRAEKMDARHYAAFYPCNYER